jgi:hypothetical protein
MTKASTERAKPEAAIRLPAMFVRFRCPYGAGNNRKAVR